MTDSAAGSDCAKSAHPWRVRIACAAAAAIVGGLSGPLNAQQPQVRDSAGVTIVTNSADARVPVWRANSTPWLAISAGTEPLHRVAGVARLNNGDIVVANAGSQEVLVFSSDGVLEARHGGPGEGPGEYRNLAWIGTLPTGDTIAAYDSRLRRITLLDSEGATISVTPLAPIPATESAVLASVAGTRTDGSWIVHGMHTPGTMEGLHRPGMSVYAYSRSGDYLRRLTTVPGREVLLSQVGGPGMGILAPLFARDAYLRTGRSFTVVANNERFSLFLHEEGSGLSRIVRLSLPLRPITRTDIARALNELVETRGSVSQSVLDVLAENAPATMPALADVLVDSDDNIWTRVYRAPDDQRADWWIFHRDGPLLARFHWNPEDVLLGVLDDSIAILRRDELGQESVQLHRLEKPR